MIFLQLKTYINVLIIRMNPHAGVKNVPIHSLLHRGNRQSKKITHARTFVLNIYHAAFMANNKHISQTKKVIKWHPFYLQLYDLSPVVHILLSPFSLLNIILGLRLNRKCAQLIISATRITLHTGPIWYPFEGVTYQREKKRRALKNKSSF